MATQEEAEAAEVKHLATFSLLNGEPRVCLTTHFETMNYQEKLGLIADWIHALHDIRKATLQEISPDRWLPITGKRTAAEIKSVQK